METFRKFARAVRDLIDYDLVMVFLIAVLGAAAACRAQDTLGISDDSTAAASMALMIETALAGAGTFLATWIYKNALRKMKVKVNAASLPWVARGISVFGLGVYKVFQMGFTWKAVGTAAAMGLVAAYTASKGSDAGKGMLGK